MKQILLSTCMVACTLPALAQPTLTAANTTALPGDSHTIYLASTSIAVGSGGANAIWDFSSLTSSSSGPITYQACPAAPECSNFSGSTLASLQSGNNAYYISDNGKMSMRGVSAGGGTVMINYSDPEDLLRYPFTYNDTYTDNLAATFTSGVTFNRSGTITVSADGYGTLITPYGTYNNVIRIHRHQVYQDVSSGIPTLNYETHLYTWYQPGIREFLVSSSELTVNGTPTQAGMQYTDIAPVTSVGAISAIESSLKLYPNPATSLINVSFSTADNQKVVFTIMDMSGKVMTSVLTNATAGNQTLKMETSSFAAGIYMLQIKAQDGTAINRKIEVI